MVVPPLFVQLYSISACVLTRASLSAASRFCRRLHDAHVTYVFPFPFFRLHCSSPCPHHAIPLAAINSVFSVRLYFRHSMP